MEDRPKVFAGVDPDLHHIPIAFIPEKEGDGPIVIVQINSDPKKKGTAAVLDVAKILGEQGTDTAKSMGLDVLSVAVENQSMKQAEKTGARKEDILKLGQVAGMMVMALTSITENMYFPSPQQWKGSVPKPIHQARICTRMGWDFKKAAGYQVPQGLIRGDDYFFACIDHKSGKVIEKDPNKGDWKHILDSIGLALYAKDVHEGNKRYRP